MKLLLIPMCALMLLAQDAPQMAQSGINAGVTTPPTKSEAKLSDAQLIAYFKARAESDEAATVAKIKADALQAAIDDMKKTCQVTLDPQTGMPTCPAPPKSDK